MRALALVALLQATPALAQTAPVVAPASAPRSAVVNGSASSDAPPSATVTASPGATPASTAVAPPRASPTPTPIATPTPTPTATATPTPTPTPTPTATATATPRTARPASSHSAVAFESAPPSAAPAIDPGVAAALARKADASVTPLPDSLDSAEVEAIIARARPSFDACVGEALAGAEGGAISGRRTGLLLLVDPAGRADGTVEDADLAARPLGACLARAAARISFPAFRGEPVAVRVPIVIGRAAASR